MMKWLVSLLLATTFETTPCLAFVIFPHDIIIIQQRGRHGNRRNSKFHTTAVTLSSSSSSSENVVDETEETIASSSDHGLSMDTLSALEETAKSAARAAGGVILSNLGCCSETSEQCEIKYSIKDVVTQYDKQAQEAVEAIVQERFPEHSFLGEENVGAGAAASEQALLDALSSTESGFIWICDPIDGTANFASGLPLCAVTMAVLYKSVPIVGVIYDPHRNEMFSTVRGHGAYLERADDDERGREREREQVHVQAAIDEARDAIVNAGCPADPNAFDVSMRGVLALNGKARGVRVIACSALTLAWIACGRLTAHFGYDLSSWDLVAGALLIQEAGGTITDINGSPYRVETRNMLCSNGYVHDEMLTILRDADAISFTRSQQK